VTGVVIALEPELSLEGAGKDIGVGGNGREFSISETSVSVCHVV